MDKCYAITLISKSHCSKRVKIFINNKSFCTFHGKKYRNDSTSIQLFVQSSYFNCGITKPVVNKTYKYETPPEDDTCCFDFLPNKLIVKILNYSSKNGWYLDRVVPNSTIGGPQ